LVFGLHAVGEPIEEDVDICGNASPIMLDKDAQIRSSKCGGTPSCSSSGSESSSSGLCFMVFIYIYFYYYRHCIIKMLFSLPFLYCKSFENMVTDFLFYCVSIIILF
jgi:hypothetical protein